MRCFKTHVLVLPLNIWAKRKGIFFLVFLDFILLLDSVNVKFIMNFNWIVFFFYLQILLVSDYFYAFLRREHHLSYGLYLKKKDGSEAALVLK